MYAAGFSFAYRSLDAGSGALILFGFVQATMILHALAGGEQPGFAEWVGWVPAAGGLTALMLPGAAAPDRAGALLMASGVLILGGISLALTRRRPSSPRNYSANTES